MANCYNRTSVINIDGGILNFRKEKSAMTEVFFNVNQILDRNF